MVAGLVSHVSILKFKCKKYQVLVTSCFNFKEITELLESWSDQLKECDRIFIRAPSYNRGLYFGGKNFPLVKHDVRIRQIPFPIRRPTFKELQRIHTLLSAVQCYGMGFFLFDTLTQCYIAQFSWIEIQL